jgi:hypothetical protein
MSLCIICTTDVTEFSVCAPEDNEEIAQSVKFNELVVPNSTCHIDSKQNYSTDVNCNLNTSNNQYCGIKLSNQNKADRRELFQRIDVSQLIPCREEKESEIISIQMLSSLVVVVSLIFALLLMVIKLRRMKCDNEKLNREMRTANMVYITNLDQNNPTSMQNRNTVEDQSYEEINTVEVPIQDWSYKYSIAEESR